MAEKRYSRHTLERIALGEIPMPDGRDERRIVTEEVAGIIASNNEILERYPPKLVASQIEARMTGTADDSEEHGTAGRENILSFSEGVNKTRSRRRVTGFAFAAAAAVLVFSGILISLFGVGDNEPTGPIRIKGDGGAAISIYRKTGVVAERLEADAIVRENDLLQIAYEAFGKSYGAVLSIDGRGVVTVHFPYDGRDAGALESGGEKALKYSYRLDDAPGFERFFFLTSDTQFNVAAAVTAATRLSQTSSGGLSGDLSLPRGVDQFSVVLMKEKSDE